MVASVRSCTIVLREQYQFHHPTNTTIESQELPTTHRRQKWQPYECKAQTLAGKYDFGTDYIIPGESVPPATTCNDLNGNPLRIQDGQCRDNVVKRGYINPPQNHYASEPLHKVCLCIHCV